MSRFRPVDRQTGYLLPPSVDEWLPEGHLARFIVEVIDEIDLSAFSQAYAGPPDEKLSLVARAKPSCSGHS